MRTRTTIAALLAIAAVGLTGCAGDDGAGTDEAFNDADVAFAQDMIPHHQQAVEMAQLAADRAASPEVKQLAQGIEAAQDPEIQTMTGWLETWGEDVPEDGMEEGMEGDMPGMMSPDQMAELEAASGVDVDRLFLTLMTEHHEGAIEMAQTEQADGENAEAVALAETIEADQTAELQTMQDLLGSRR